MNFEYKQLLPAEFSGESRIWIYQSNRLFTFGEALQTEEMLNNFVEGWLSHGIPVKGYANLFFGQFLVLMADESETGVSGCSTDNSVKVIRQIETVFGVNLFDRLSLAFIIRDKVQLLPLSQIEYALENKYIDKDTLYFNNMVQTKKELEDNWIIPIQDSWLSKKINQQVFSAK
jgi:hypothetical protein